jgi:hypothetical protein
MESLWMVRAISNGPDALKKKKEKRDCAGDVATRWRIKAYLLASAFIRRLEGIDGYTLVIPQVPS